MTDFSHNTRNARRNQGGHSLSRPLPTGATPQPTSKTWARSGCRKYLGAELMFALAGWPGKTGEGEGHPALGWSPCEPKPTKICKVQPNFILTLGFATTAPTLCIQSHKWPLVQSKVQAPPRHHPGHPEATGSSPAQHPNAKSRAATHTGEQ